MHALLIVPFLLATVAAIPADAQDVGPALDPGAIVGWTGGEAVRADNERRTGHAAPVRRISESEARARSVCARRYSIRTRLGKNSPQARKLMETCRQAGYF